MRKKILILCLTIILYMMISVSFSSTNYLSADEKKWLADNKNKTFNLGLDPFSGMDYFKFRGGIDGYLIDLKELIVKETGIKINIVGDKSWGEVYKGLQDGSVDILFGANKTPKRMEFMSFTNPVYKYPYSIFAEKNSDVKTIGDLDKKTIGFIDGDIVINVFKNLYNNISYKKIEYNSQIDGLEALSNGEIDGFITSGGQIAYEFKHLYPNVSEVAEISTITSDMTLSTRKNETILANILNSVIDENYNEILESIKKAKINYNRKILEFNDDELNWLDGNKEIVVGVPDDYLPFDYFNKGKYEGIAGEIFNEISNIVGFKYRIIHAPFNKLYYMALQGKIDVLDMAKTEEREKLFIFTRPFNKERDIIIGRKSSLWIQDIYGLENKKVAVVDGYWHKGFLEKNLKNPNIVITKNIEDSLEQLENKKVDYVIENPTVIDFYKDGLGFSNIVMKGNTSRESFFYFGINKDKRELASIVDKAITLIDYDKLKNIGLSTAPNLKNRNTKKLIAIVIILIFVVLLMVFALIRMLKAYINQNVETKLLKDKEKMFYTDALTNAKSRMYFNKIEESIDFLKYPQAIIITDLNNLKYINDKYGHFFGDELIKKFSEILIEFFSNGEIIRMGGDEFLIILEETTENICEFNFNKIFQKCEETKICDGDICIEGPSASYGIVIRENSSYDLKQARIDADIKMYEMKNKNRI
ncbi:transporter substrate-binding domain-containing protein [Helicovermis profundi]|uniref:GGDEF domain-containing protein n=1 Tax=Helicovermis profundi TaxID=3065157 RepID=A0AAU9E0I7_9FIRM|nr:hypothetical protein HLPR_01070 [Clostridia bacterium S502]